MCIELPGRVVEVVANRPGFARVDVGGVIKTVHLGMLDGKPPQAGEWLALHLGFAIERMTEAQAREALAYAENDPFEASVAAWNETRAASTATRDAST